MRDVSLTLVQTFYIVAREKTYSAAAKTLNMSYQSAANHVRRLEQIIGEPLIISQQGVKVLRLTPRGKSLLNLLEPELETMLARLGRILDTERPVLRVGMPQAVFYHLFLPILEQYRNLHPTVEIIGYERDTILEELVRDGSLDICITERQFGDSGIRQHRLGSYGMSLILPRSWGLSEGLSLRELAQSRTFMTFEPGQVIRDMALDYLQDRAGDVRINISMSSMLSIQRSVEMGMGYSIVPNWCVEEGNRLVQALPLDDMQRMPLFFGEAEFLKRNLLVRDMRRLFQEHTAPKLAEAA